MFLLSEEEFFNEASKINWQVFSNFSGSSDEVDNLKNQLHKASRYYKDLDDKKLYKERGDVSKVITTVLRFLLDLEGSLDVVFAPFTLGLTLVTFLVTRILRVAVDTPEEKYYKKQAEDAIYSLKELKKKQPKKAKEIDEHIKKIEKALDDIDY